MEFSNNFSLFTRLIHFSLSSLQTQKLNDGKFPQLIPPNPAIRALLVFNKDDQVYEALSRACERLNIETTRVKTVDSTHEILHNASQAGHQLVIVDGRCKNIDAESLGR